MRSQALFSDLKEVSLILISKVELPPIIFAITTFVLMTLGSSALVAQDSIPVGGHELQRESDWVRQDTSYRCNRNTLRMIALFTKHSISVTSITFNSRRLSSRAIANLNMELARQSGFDFAFLTCTSSHAQLNFQKTNNGSESEIYSLPLN